MARLRNLRGETRSLAKRLRARIPKGVARGADGGVSRVVADNPVDERLDAKLQRTVLEPELYVQLGGPTRVKSIEELKHDISAFRAVDEAIRRSHDYQRQAIAKAYEIWYELCLWEGPDRIALLRALNRDNAVKSGEGQDVHVLLRALISYDVDIDPRAPKAEQRRARQRAYSAISRDASALRYGVRINVQPTAFAHFARQFGGGLDGMARAEADAKRPERPLPRKLRPEALKLAWSADLQQIVLARLRAGGDVVIRLRGDSVRGPVRVEEALALPYDDQQWSQIASRLDDLVSRDES